MQFATLGGGNHFVEMQSDEDGQLWLMIHTGSRVIGQEVRGLHVTRSVRRSINLPVLDVNEIAGQMYLADQNWARAYAAANRIAIGQQVMEAMKDLFDIDPATEPAIHCDHNHVQIETHFDQQLLVHRKGAAPAGLDQPAVIPGSMGTFSVHVMGRGCPESLASCSHGAGRQRSRAEARERYSVKDLQNQMGNVWYDPRLKKELVEECPKSYKDLRGVLAAETELIRITRVLKPMLVYKGA